MNKKKILYNLAKKHTLRRTSGAGHRTPFIYRRGGNIFSNRFHPWVSKQMFSGSLTQTLREPRQLLSTCVSGPLNLTTKIRLCSRYRQSPLLSVTGIHADGGGDLWVTTVCFMQSVVVVVSLRVWQLIEEVSCLSVKFVWVGVDWNPFTFVQFHQSWVWRADL